MNDAFDRLRSALADRYVLERELGAGGMATVYRSGVRLRSVDSLGPASPVSLSPDETRATGLRRLPWVTHGNVWLRDLVRGVEAPFTFDSTMPQVSNAVWSPSGDRIAFTRTSSDGPRLHIGEVATGEVGDGFVGNGFDKTVTDWSRDGFLVYTQIDPETVADLWYLQLNGEGMEPVPFRVDQFETSFGQVSPDGRWLAYISNETGSYEVWVQAFPSGPGKWRISESESSSGATQQPRWSRDGSELFYLTGSSGRSTMMAAPVSATTSSGSSPVAEPRPLFEVRVNGYAPNFSTFFYHVSADGERFLIDVVDSEIDPAIYVVVNWEELLIGRE